MSSQLQTHLPDVVLSYVGTPFVHQGRCPGVGLDCVGVLWCGLRALGRSVDDFRIYARFPAPSVLDYEMTRRFGAPSAGPPEPGMAVSLIVARSKRARHLGVIVPDGRYVHAHDAHGVMVSRLRVERVDKMWRVA